MPIGLGLGEAVQALKLAQQAYAALPTAMDIAIDVGRYFIGKSSSVFIIGPPGVGKSTLGRLIAQGNTTPITGAYDLSEKKETIKIAKRWMRTVSIIPGQTQRAVREAEWNELMDEIRESRHPIVFFVGSCGYASESKFSPTLPDQNDASACAGFIRKYISFRRGVELRTFEEFADRVVIRAGAKLHFVYVVSKLDFWHSSLSDVVSYYSGRKFVELENKLVRRIGTTRMITRVLPISLGDEALYVLEEKTSRRLGIATRCSTMTADEATASRRKFLDYAANAVN